VPTPTGTWRQLTDNVNQLAASLDHPDRAISEVATAVTRHLTPQHHGRGGRRGREAQGQHQPDIVTCGDHAEEPGSGLAQDETWRSQLVMQGQKNLDTGPRG